MSNVACVECEAEVEVAAGAFAGEIIECAECGVELEVTSVEPPAVALAPEVEEDWGE